MTTKIFALSISVVFFLANGPFLYAAEANVWTQRRQAQKEKKTYQVSSLPAGMGGGWSGRPESLIKQFPKLNVTLGEVVSPTLKKKTKGIDGAFLQLLKNLPRSSARLQKVHRPSGTVPDQRERAVFLIQDIHMNYEAQANIARVFKALTEKTPEAYPGQTLSVAVEGAYGEFDFSMFRSFPDQELMKDVADYFLQEGVIAAPSYTGLAMPNETPPFYGVDDKQHYEANVKAYQQAMLSKETLVSTWDAAKRALAEEKRKSLNKALLEFDNFQTAHQKGDIDLGAYLKRLTKLREKGASRNAAGGFELVIEKFVGAYDLEKQLDFQRVERQRTTVIRQLASRLQKEDVTHLIQMGLGFRLGKISYADYYRHILDLLKRHSISLAGVPEFNRYIQYVLLADSIDSSDLFEAIRRFETTVQESLTQGEEEKRLMAQSRRLYLEGKLLDFALIPEEWDEYQKIVRDSRPATPGLSSFEDFYVQADIRSEKMVNNFLAQMEEDKADVGAILTGGFHSPQMTKLLRAKGVSVAIVQPNITKIDTLNGSEYLSVFTREKTPVERLFEGRKLFLAIAAQAAGAPGAAETTARVAETMLLQSAPREPGRLTVPGVGEVEMKPDGTVAVRLPGSNVWEVRGTFRPNQVGNNFERVGAPITHKAEGTSRFRPLQFLREKGSQLKAFWNFITGAGARAQRQAQTLTLTSTYVAGRIFFFLLFGVGFLIRFLGGDRALDRTVEIFFAPFFEIPLTFFPNFIEWHNPQLEEQRQARTRGLASIRFWSVVGLVVGVVVAAIVMITVLITGSNASLLLFSLAPIIIPGSFVGSFNAVRHMGYNIRNPDAPLAIKSWGDWERFKSSAGPENMIGGMATPPIILGPQAVVGVSIADPKPIIFIMRTRETRTNSETSEVTIRLTSNAKENYVIRTDHPNYKWVREEHNMILRPGQRVYLGRSEQSGIRSERETLSRYHIQIELDFEGRLVMTDLLSGNGSEVRMLGAVAGQSMEFVSPQDRSSADLPALPSETEGKAPRVAAPESQGTLASRMLSMADISRGDLVGGSAPRADRRALGSAKQLRLEKKNIDKRRRELAEGLRNVSNTHPDFQELEFKIEYIEVLIEKRDKGKLDRDLANNTIYFILTEAEDLLVRAVMSDDELNDSWNDHEPFLRSINGRITTGEGARFVGIRQVYDVYTLVYRFGGQEDFHVAVKIDADGNLITVELERRNDRGQFHHVPLVQNNRDGLALRQSAAGRPNIARTVDISATRADRLVLNVTWENETQSTYRISLNPDAVLFRVQETGGVLAPPLPPGLQPVVDRRLFPVTEKGLADLGSVFQPFSQMPPQPQGREAVTNVLGLKEQDDVGGREFNQDRVVLLPGNSVVLADGNSSGNGDLGAGTAVGTFASWILAFLNSGRVKTWKGLMMAIRRALYLADLAVRNESVRESVSPSASTTITGHIAFRFNNRPFALFYNVGDSMNIIYRSSTREFIFPTDLDNAALSAFRLIHGEKLKGDEGLLTLQAMANAAIPLYASAPSRQIGGKNDFVLNKDAVQLQELEEGDVIISLSDISENFKLEKDLSDVIDPVLDQGAEAISGAIEIELRKRIANQYFRYIRPRREFRQLRNIDDDVKLDMERRLTNPGWKADDANFSVVVVGASFGANLTLANTENEFVAPRPVRFQQEDRDGNLVNDYTYTGPASLSSSLFGSVMLFNFDSGREARYRITQKNGQSQSYKLTEKAVEIVLTPQLKLAAQFEGGKPKGTPIASIRFSPSGDYLILRDLSQRNSESTKPFTFSGQSGISVDFVEGELRPENGTLTLPWVKWLGRLLLFPIVFLFGAKVADAITALFIAPLIEIPFTFRSSFAQDHTPRTQAELNWLIEGQNTIQRASRASAMVGLILAMALLLFFTTAAVLGMPISLTTLSTTQLIGLAFVPLSPVIAANSGAHFYRNLLSVAAEASRWNAARTRARARLAQQRSFLQSAGQGRTLDQILDDLAIPPIFNLGVRQAALSQGQLRGLIGRHFRQQLPTSRLEEEIPALSHLPPPVPEPLRNTANLDLKRQTR